MIVEYIRYDLTRHNADELIAAYRVASKNLQESLECQGFDLTRCEEASSSFILRIRWTSTADHLQKFRKGPHFPPFFAAIRPFVDESSRCAIMRTQVSNGRAERERGQSRGFAFARLQRD